MDKNRSKQLVFFGLILLIFVIYTLRLASLQLGDVPYKKMAINNALNKITLYPSRSNVFDRKGKLMVYSTQMYDLSVFPFEIKKLDTGLLCSVLELDIQTVRGLIADARVRAKKRQKNNSFNNSALFYANLSNKQFTLLRENIYRLDGFFIESRTDRQFATATLSHALGYLGEADEELIASDEYYQPGDLVGITGLERYYEKQIRGIKGVKTVWQDRTYTERGVVKDTQFNYPATAGPDVISSLDFVLQEKTIVQPRGEGRVPSWIHIQNSYGFDCYARRCSNAGNHTRLRRWISIGEHSRWVSPPWRSARFTRIYSNLLQQLLLSGIPRYHR